VGSSRPGRRFRGRRGSGAPCQSSMRVDVSTDSHFQRCRALAGGSSPSRFMPAPPTPSIAYWIWGPPAPPCPWSARSSALDPMVVEFKHSCLLIRWWEDTLSVNRCGSAAWRTASLGRLAGQPAGIRRVASYPRAAALCRVDSATPGEARRRRREPVSVRDVRFYRLNPVRIALEVLRVVDEALRRRGMRPPAVGEPYASKHTAATVLGRERQRSGMVSAPDEDDAKPLDRTQGHVCCV